MPELPEIETIRCGIAPHIKDKIIDTVEIRQHALRQPVTRDLNDRLQGQRITAIERRAKYLFLHTANGALIIHLGMSGSLRIVSASTPIRKHDHVDIRLTDNTVLRFRDPRRFGLILWGGPDPHRHQLIAHLGPEPLGDTFDGKWLYQCSRNRRKAVKPFLMDGRVVVGVGNIYANEALFRARIDPRRAAGRIACGRYQLLAAATREVLEEAITQGGTTLRDFVGGDGRPGYFAQHLNVYGRRGEPCPRCRAAIRHLMLGQRSTYFCPCCQR